jgi:uncharacterized protein YkwD
MRTFITIAFIVTLSLTACVSISHPPPASTALLFNTATLPATSTAYASPTPISSATVPASTLSVTSAADCKDSAVLLQDVTIADGTNVPRGNKFTKTWQFQNTGSCAWSNYTIAFVSGDRMSAPDSAPIPDTASKANVNVSVDLVAPAADGAYTGFFELRNANGQALSIGIEKTFWVKITVGTALVPTAAPLNTTVPGTPSGGTPVSKPKGPASCKYVASGSYPGEIANLINQARGQAGLPALTIDSQLTAAAQGHSIDMACFSLLSHSGSDGSTPAQRVAAAGYSGAYRQEIIYAGGYPQDAYNWWMNDQIHHDAILDSSATEMGVGYAYVSDSAYGGYFTVDFGSR